MMNNNLHTSSAVSHPKRLGAILGEDLYCEDDAIVRPKKKRRETDHTRYNSLDRLETHLPPAPHDVSLPTEPSQTFQTKFPEDKRPPEVRPLPSYVIREFNEAMRSLNPDDPCERRFLSIGMAMVERYEELKNNPWNEEI